MHQSAMNGAGGRWPPAVALLGALVMVFLVLPNPLRVPQNNPTASAEYAPVPGRQESSQDANFGETGQASSGGIGAGGTGEGLGEGSQAIKPPPQFRPRQNECVDKPPRQTEDELSPPCVAFFSGDNGGKTWVRGVTKDEIVIGYYNDFGVEGDMTTPYRPSEEQGDQTHYYYQNHTKTVKALLRYFSRHYQTYGRRVRMIAYPSQGGLGTEGEQRKGEALDLLSTIQPFAVATLIENAQEFAPFMAERQVPTFGWNEDVPVIHYRQNAPYFWSMMPDQETESRWSASFICDKLKGLPARFTTDPTLIGQTRKFGLLWPRESQRGPFLAQLSALLQKETRRQCGLEWTFKEAFSGNGSAGRIMTTMKQKGVTTVVCYCVPQQTELHVPALQNAATSINYFPEWYWDHASAMDRALWQRTYGSKLHQGFGVSNLWRQPAFKESHAYQAFLEEEPGGVPNLRFIVEMYHVFLNLFSGIQAAGPNLTPDSIKRGMFTFQYLKRDNPFVPTGSYGDAGPSPYTFVDTAMGWWYDPTGTPPGGSNRDGCIRVMYEGRRFYWNEWPRKGKDDDIKQDPKTGGGWPCTEDTRKDVETG